MTISPIKKARLLAGFTQSAAAENMNVTQPTYFRWETGSNPPPKDKLPKLAELFNTTTEELLGNTSVFDVLGYNPEVASNRTYFGEASIHFISGNPPLLIPISEYMFNFLHEPQIWFENQYLVIESLDNRLILVPRKAIADVFLNSEDAEEFGPDSYPPHEHIGLFPDEKFWRVAQIAEFLDDDDESRDECNKLYGKKFVDETIALCFMTETQMDEFDKQDNLSDEDSRESRERVRGLMNAFRTRARCAVWQLQSGQKREMVIDEASELYECLHGIFESPDGHEGFLYLTAEDYTSHAYINPEAIDYLSVPTHTYLDGKVKTLEEEIDEPSSPTGVGKISNLKPKIH